MKKLTLILSALFLSTVAFAEMKPAGTVLANFCGDTQTFPTSVKVCIAGAQGTGNAYLMINSYGELAPVDSTKTSYIPVTVTVQELEIYPPIVKTTYEGVRVVQSGNYAVEQKVKLVTTGDRTGMEFTGNLYFNDQTFFGSENIDFEMMFHTMSL
jgi:hypothetical protein